MADEHEVLAVTAATEAYALLRDGAQFDLILCDLMMPEMSGMDLHTQLRKLVPDPTAKFVFMIGGAFTSDAGSFLAQIPNPSIEKPIRASKLRSLVRGLIQ